MLPLLIVGCATTPTEDLRASGEDFPLKYTCELGNIIMFISFDVDGIATFFYHESNYANKTNGKPHSFYRNFKTYMQIPIIIMVFVISYLTTPIHPDQNDNNYNDILDFTP